MGVPCAGDSRTQLAAQLLVIDKMGPRDCVEFKAASILRHQGFASAERVELYSDALTMEQPRPSHDLTDPAVVSRLRELANAASAPNGHVRLFATSSC